MSTHHPAPRPVSIDPRGPRFTAYVTAVVLAFVLLTAPSRFATALLACRPRCSPWAPRSASSAPRYAWVFRTVVRPRLAAPSELEDAAPPRFAQAVGLGFALVGLVGFVAGLDLLGLVATGLALVAALLNAVFGLCLGCEMYLLIRPVVGRTPRPSRNADSSTSN